MSVTLSRVGGTGADLPASMVRVGGISTDIDMYDDGLSVSGETINDINVEVSLHDGSFHVVVSETCSVSGGEPVTKTRISTLVYDDSYNVEMVPTGGMSVRMSLVCPVDISELLSRLKTTEGYVLTIQGGYIYVINEQNG